MSIITLAVWVALSGCSKKEDAQMDLSALVPPTAVVVTPEEPPKKLEFPKYFYPYLDERDPFAPLLAGSGTGRPGSMTLMQNFGNLELKGILRDRGGKVAIIGTSSGENFVLKSGRIYDQRNHIVTGVTGIIKEGSVVLITSNRTVKELPLRRTGGYYR